MTLKKKYKQNIEDHFIELHKKLSALQSEHLKKIMNYITHGDTNMTPKPTFETVPVTFESDKSWMDCDKCDVHSPCAEHSVDESDKWLESLLSEERNKVLDEVKKEVESEYFEMNDDFVGAGNVITISSLETILEKLKVK